MCDNVFIRCVSASQKSCRSPHVIIIVNLGAAGKTYLNFRMCDSVKYKLLGFNQGDLLIKLYTG